ncbi:MAG TPA: metallophosphoesterase family protein [Blastocatellia bacterium]
MRLGLISDTHGLFDSALPELFASVDLIVHAGDIGKLEVVERLEQIAPVLAVEGNNDWFNRFPTERLEYIAGRRIVVRHIFGELHQIGPPERALVEQLRPDILVFGHTHRPYIESLGETILINPGSAGPRRFKLPRTVGLLSIGESHLESEIINLG